MKDTAHAFAVSAMGTRFELVLDADDAARARAAGDEATDVIREWHDALSVFAPASLLSFLNAHAARRAVPVDRDTFDLLRTVRDVWSASDGAFDPAIAPAMRATGRHATPHAYESGPAQRRRRRGSFADVELDDDACTVRFRDATLALDFGAIGKGHALACARRELADAGIASGFLHGGTSTALAFGARDATITLPDHSTLTLRNAALSVSAHDGPQYGHVLDPRTGAAADRATWCAVIAPCPRLADAWSTALLVRGARPAALDASITTFICPPDGVVDAAGPLVPARRAAPAPLAS